MIISKYIDKEQCYAIRDIWSRNLTKQQQHLPFKGKMEIKKWYASKNVIAKSFVVFRLDSSVLSSIFHR